tara:strand:- start:540 stop:1235 length:696 start_codon:yes stop_codon:yes gene_type:complete
MSKRAIILAGGLGTRLKPYTLTMPKPLVPVGHTPILEIIIQQLVKYGFNHITITINHMADMIKDYFGDGSKWKIKIDYSLESKPLSTIGPLSLISDLPEYFLIMNGDVLTDLDYAKFYDFHINSGNIYTISSYQREQMNDYGVLYINNNNLLVDFKEKPKTILNVSMGVYMASKRLIDHIPNNKKYGFDDLMKDLIKKNEKINVKKHNGYWLDIGRPDDYERACQDVLKII